MDNKRLRDNQFGKNIIATYTKLHTLICIWTHVHVQYSNITVNSQKVVCSFFNSIYFGFIRIYAHGIPTSAFHLPILPFRRYTHMLTCASELHLCFM